ncbi:MAG: hypothetical protein RIS76_2488 [Verrucomicrobiota bacterium]|jgi:hypothetical protein
MAGIAVRTPTLTRSWALSPAAGGDLTLQEYFQCLYWCLQLGVENHLGVK